MTTPSTQALLDALTTSSSSSSSSSRSRHTSFQSYRHHEDQEATVDHSWMTQEDLPSVIQNKVNFLDDHLNAR